MLSGKIGCIRAKLVVFRARVVVIRQSGCNRARWLYSDKVVVFGQKWLYLVKLVVIGQKLFYSGKLVVFGLNWLYLGSVVVFGKMIVFGQKLFSSATCLYLRKIGSNWAYSL